MTWMNKNKYFKTVWLWNIGHSVSRGLLLFIHTNLIFKKLFKIAYLEIKGTFNAVVCRIQGRKHIWTTQRTICKRRKAIRNFPLSLHHLLLYWLPYLQMVCTDFFLCFSFSLITLPCFCLILVLFSACSWLPQFPTGLLSSSSRSWLPGVNESFKFLKRLFGISWVRCHHYFNELRLEDRTLYSANAKGHCQIGSQTCLLPVSNLIILICILISYPSILSLLQYG